MISSPGKDRVRSALGSSGLSAVGCTSRWIPLLESDLRRGSLPFNARALSYVNRPDGRQVEYDGHPLYLYAGDSSLRQIEGSGNGTDGTWFTVTPDLKPTG
jgi:predicted lipoprotein with Yx(FWY)xxD motif